MSSIPSDLEQAIIRTLAWFSLFSHSLTAFDIWKWLLEPDGAYTTEQVIQCLNESEWIKTRLVSQDGLFVLAPANTEELIARRQQRFLDAKRKMRKLKRIATLFRFLPGIRAVAACNNLAWFSTGPTSDIDLFIVVKPGSIWMTRLLLVIPFLLFGKRPRADRSIRDPFCFSFFLSEDRLSLTPFLLQGKDPYFAYWLASLIPVFDRGGVLEKLFDQNQWVRSYLPNAFPRSIHRDCTIRVPGGRMYPARTNIPEFFESLAKRIQMRYFPAIIRKMANQDTRVVVNDHALKFHENDRRGTFCQEHESRFQSCL